MFDEKWFIKNQKILLWLLNAPLIKYWFRYCLRIRRYDCKSNIRITEIYPNRFSFGDRYLKKGKKLYLERTTDFRTHCKFSKRMWYAFRPLWKLCHLFDTQVANRFYPAWNLGFDSQTFYPAAVDSVDGAVGEMYGAGSGKTWAVIQGGAGNYNRYGTSPELAGYIACDTTSNQYIAIQRLIILYNTAGLGAGANISAATMSLYGSAAAYDDWGATAKITIYTSTPASNTVLANSDYVNVGTTAQSDTSFNRDTPWSAVQYNDFPLNATGRGNIAKTGVTKFGVRELTYDVANSAPTWTSSWSCYFGTRMSEATGTTQDPKLVVTYSSIVTAFKGSFSMLGVGQ